MPEIKLNPWKNRLYIIFNNWNRADLPNYVERLETGCNELLPGFTCVAMFDHQKGVSKGDRSLLLDTAELISAYGASCIVWVNPESSGKRLAGHPDHQIRIPVAVAADLISAERMLDSQTDYTTAHEMDYLVFRALNQRGATRLHCDCP